MARRGEALREHILDTAAHAFLETGFERTSMDAIATRAATSKRSLYAHFPTKDTLFLAVVERIRVLFGEKMGVPAEYAEQPAEATARYCGRFVQLLHWSTVGKMMRLGIDAAERLPDLATGLYDVLFQATTDNLARHLSTAFELTAAEAATAANELIGLAVHPTLPRLLFGVDSLTEELPERTDLAADVDLDRIRQLFHLVMAPKTER